MPKLVSSILYRVFSKTVFLIFAFLFLISIPYTLYPIPFVHASIRDFPDCETVTQTPVTANVTPHETYLDIVSNAIFYPGVNQEIKDSPQNDKTVCPGISNNFLQGVFPSFVCSIGSLIGLDDFCPQALSLGENTVEFDSKTSLFKDANLYPNLIYDKQPSEADVIQDTIEQEVGDQVISDVADRAGWKNGYYVVGIPEEVSIEGNTVKLLEDLDEEASLTQGRAFEDERTGQLCPSADLYTVSTFYPGMAPNVLKECEGFVPSIPAN